MKRVLSSSARYLFLTAVALLSIFPLYWMVVAATNETIDVMRGTLIPAGYFVENVKSLFAAQNVGRALGNSFLNASLLTLASMAVCSIAGYGFEIYHTRAKDRLMSVLLLAMMVPFAATLIPLFQTMADIGLLNTTLGFMLPTVSTPFLIMMFRQNSRSFPHDIIEAARIDGLGEFGIFVRMFIPTMKSTYAAAMTIVFMNAWNNYLWPKVIMLSDEGATMPMLVANLIAGNFVDYGMLMLAVLLCTLPTVIVFFVLQKSFTEGIVGAVK